MRRRVGLTGLGIALLLAAGVGSAYGQYAYDFSQSPVAAEVYTGRQTGRRLSRRSA